MPSPNFTASVVAEGDDVAHDGPPIAIAGITLPERFARTVIPDDPGQPIVRLVVVLDRGRPTCESVEVRRHPGGPPVTSSGLRIPLETYVRKAVDGVGATAKIPVIVRSGDGPAEAATASLAAVTRTAAYRKATRPRRSARPRPPRVSDEQLARARDAYREARAAGEPPRQAIEDKLNVSPTTAARYVTMARARRIMGPSLGPGRAGEAPLPSPRA